MNIASAVFDRSAPDLEGCPDESLPEFAFIGRSNVGKSSLLNMLVGKGGLARVSPTPGFTKMINFFKLNKTWRLVDLPGYGYAHTARKEKAQFNRAVNRYLKHRPNLCCVFALIDSGLPPQPIDLEFVEWLTRQGISYVLVFTKADQGTQESVQANVAAFKAAIAGWFQTPPQSFLCSSTTSQGRTELLAMISETLAAGPAPEPEASTEAPAEPLPPEKELPFDVQVRAGSEREKIPMDKKKLKQARPW